jgi:hypothetical protein
LVWRWILADSALDILRAARQALAHEEDWCRECSPVAGKKSLLMAVGYHWHKADYAETLAAVDLLARMLGRDPSVYNAVHVQGFDETHTHAEVLDLLDRAIAHGEAVAAARPRPEPTPIEEAPLPC